VAVVVLAELDSFSGRLAALKKIEVTDGTEVPPQGRLFETLRRWS